MGICSELRHPNIIRVLDYGSYQDFEFIVMEYAPGRGLDEALQDATLAEVVEVFRQVGRGVEYAHSKNIVHRDLKPENVQVGFDGSVKVLDFGLAKELDEGHLTATVESKFTLAYASPEQICNFRDVRETTDQFSLGVMLYEALARQSPFRDLTMMGRLSEENNSIPLRTVRPELHQVGEVLSRMMTYRPEDRYESVEQALAAFEIACAGEACHCPDPARELSCV